jgi:tetratricopeptide (TPR) repeat protein
VVRRGGAAEEAGHPDDEKGEEMNEPHDPKRRLTLALAVTLLLALVANGPAQAMLAVQVRQVKPELNEAEKDRLLLAALHEAALAQAETTQNRFAMERAVPLLREAFRAYGMPAGKGEPAVAAKRIRERPAAVREVIVAALDEWDDLAGNPMFRIEEPHREWLRAVLEAAEPKDAWGRHVRAARAEKYEAKRRTALEKLAVSADIARVPARALTRLAERLAPAPQVALLRRTQAMYPSDFWVNHNLGMAHLMVNPSRWDEAVRFLTAAVALRPASPGARLNLGFALAGKGEADEAIACYRQAIALDQKYAMAHNNLGNVLKARGQVDEAIACFRKVIELNPKNAQAHNNLGTILCDIKHDHDGAVACFRKAIALDPKLAIAHNNLGNALMAKGQVDEAIACFKKAIALHPKLAIAHNNLGHALLAKGQVDQAVACFRQAIALDPKLAIAHNNLGHALLAKGQVDQAIVCFRKAIALDPKAAMAHLNLGLALKRNGQMDEAIACCQKAIGLDPKEARAHYSLACLAALAAADHGEKAAKRDDKERARLRKQTLDSLRAALALFAGQLKTGKRAGRAAVQKALVHWETDPDLTSIRDAADLAKLPADERKAFTQLWASVAALLKKARESEIGTVSGIACTECTSLALLGIVCAKMAPGLILGREGHYTRKIQR